jgi:hypothetical protein
MKIFFSHIKRRKREPALVKKFLRDVESGYFASPKCLNALPRCTTLASD